jgi:hypothetical protein
MPLYWGWAAEKSSLSELTDISHWRLLLVTRLRAVEATEQLERAVSSTLNSVGKFVRPEDLSASHALDAALAALAAADNATFLVFNSHRDAASAVYSSHIAVSTTADSIPTAAYEDVWSETRRDANLFQGTQLTGGLSLWPDNVPPAILFPWQRVREALSKQIRLGDTGWQFWIDWYEAQLTGADQNWEMLKEIVLIPDEDWKQGAAHVNAMIAEIVEKYKPDDVERPLKTLLAEMEAGSKASIARVKGAMIANRSELPPTFDAVLGFISLEVQRLQNRNYRDDADEEESKRQIRTLTTLYQAVEGLQTLVPVADTMSEVDAEKAERLSRLFLNSFRKWPRENVDEVADSTYRFGLVGASSYVLTLLGMQPGHALAAASVFFAGKRIVETAKAAKDLFNPGGAP